MNTCLAKLARRPQRAMGILIALAVCFSPTAGAVECFANSPILENQGDIYSPPDERPLTLGERGEVHEIFALMAGGWEGHGTSFECRGSERNPHIIFRHYDIEAVTESTSDHHVALRFTLLDNETNSSRAEALGLYLHDMKLRVDTPSASGDVGIVSLAKDNVSFLKWIRAQNQPVHEVVRTISVNAYQLVLQIDLYVQGKLASSYTLNLSRSR